MSRGRSRAGRRSTATWRSSAPVRSGLVLASAAGAARTVGRRSSSSGPAPYPLPRAVHFDHEVGRILQSCGIGDELRAVSEPAEVYEWRNAAGTTLLRFGRIGTGAFGLAVLVDVLPARARGAARGPGSLAADARDPSRRRASTRSSSTTTMSSSAARPATPSGPRTSSAVTARTRRCATCSASTMDDRGFFYDWLIVDVILDEPRVFDPINLQICDPSRPTTAVSGGPGSPALGVHAPARRDRSRSWARSPPPGSCSRRGTCTPATRALERHAVYTFQPASPTVGRSGASSSPATPRTRCRRSPGRACAPASATRPTSRGSSTSSLTGRAGTGAARDVRRRASAERGRRDRLLDRARQGHLRARPGRGRRRVTRRWRRRSPTRSPRWPDLPGIASRRRRPELDAARASCSRRANLGGRWFDDVHGAGWRLVTVDPDAADLDAVTRRLVRLDRRRRGRCRGAAPDLDGLVRRATTCTGLCNDPTSTSTAPRSTSPAPRSSSTTSVTSWRRRTSGITEQDRRSTRRVGALPSLHENDDMQTTGRTL